MPHAPVEMSLFKIVKTIEKRYLENGRGALFFSEGDFREYVYEELKKDGAKIKSTSGEGIQLPFILEGNNSYEDICVGLTFSWGNTIPEVAKRMGEELEKLRKCNNSYLFFYDQSGKLVEKDISKVAREKKNTKTKVVYFNLENKEVYTYPPGLIDAI